jgi:acetate---CoA ligase (ADP-forming)
VDMIASAQPEHYARALELVGADPGIDAAIAVYVPPMMTQPAEIAAAIAQGAGRVPAEKPVVAVFIDSNGVPEALGSGPRGRLPAYRFPENAARALAAAGRYGRWRSRPRGEIQQLTAFSASVVRAVVERNLADAAGPVWLDSADVVTLLETIGVDVVASSVSTPEAAPETAARLGFPVVAKAVAPGVVHRSEVGGVILGLRSAADVASAVSDLRSRMRTAGTHLEAVLLQRQVEGGIEALVGVTADPTFGPLLVCGLGGVLVEAIGDVAFALTPVSDLDATGLVSKLRTSRLLRGYRGLPAGDRPALERILCRISALAEAAPEILEMDLNPVKVLPPGQGAVVVDARIRVGRA